MLLLLVFYCACILVASLAGGWIPLFIHLTHTRLQVAISFVAGLMLGVGILHLLPHAWLFLDSIDQTAWWLLAGFMAMFFIQRFFHFHHHDVPADTDDDVSEACAHDHSPAEPPAHAHSGHDHEGHDHESNLAERSARKLSWGGAALGLTLHTLMDGMALAASVQAEAHAPHRNGLLGFGTFLVVILHKPFDAMAVGTLMATSGSSRVSRHTVNFLFALANPLGVLLFYVGISQLLQASHAVLGAALAFAAGTFLCIAASDLLPELQFHSHDRGKLSVALLAGVGLAAAIGLIEPGGHEHWHGHEEVPPASLPASGETAGIQ